MLKRVQGVTQRSRFLVVVVVMCILRFLFPITSRQRFLSFFLVSRKGASDL